MEYRKKCNVCGNVFCYTDEDIDKTIKAAGMSGLAALGTMAGALSGNWGAARVNQEYDKKYDGKIKDFAHCPNCNSVELVLLSDEEWEEHLKEQQIKNGGLSINSNASIEMLLKRIKIFIEDKDWPTAKAYVEQALDLDPENGEVYYLKMLAEYRVQNETELVEKGIAIDACKDYNKVLRFGTDEVRKKVKYVQDELARLKYEEEMRQKEAQEKLLRRKIDDLCQKASSDSLDKVSEAIVELKKLSNQNILEEYIKEKIFMAETKKEMLLKRKAHKNKKLIKIFAPIILVALAALVYYTMVVAPAKSYEAGMKYLNADNYGQAIIEFGRAGDYKDSKEKLEEAQRLSAEREKVLQRRKEEAAMKSIAESLVEQSPWRGECSPYSTVSEFEIDFKSDGNLELVVEDYLYGKKTDEDVDIAAWEITSIDMPNGTCIIECPDIYFAYDFGITFKVYFFENYTVDYLSFSEEHGGVQFNVKLE